MLEHLPPRVQSLRGAFSPPLPRNMTSESTLADLTASCRRTTGQRPPALVGASCSLVSSSSSSSARLYVFGGRLVPKRVLVADLYVLDLTSLVWTKLWPPEDAKVVEFSPDSVEELAGGTEGHGKRPQPDVKQVRGPQARYFHSADVMGDSIYFFGGMGIESSTPSPDSRPNSPALSNSSKASRGSKASKDSKSSRKSNDQQRQQTQQQQQQTQEETPFCVLNDLVIYNTATNTWHYPRPSVASYETASPGLSPPSQGPAARYAHLSCITNNCLVILGGQSLSNQHIQEINVLDMERMLWIDTRRFEGQVGTYRSVLASRPVTLHSGSSSDRSRRRSLLQEASKTSATSSGSTAGSQDPGPADLVQLSYASAPDMEPLWLFSNFSFTNVKRSLSMLSAPRAPNFACPVSHLSHLMSGSVLPPGLRFPTGSVIGHHLIITGTFLSHTTSSFAIWALDLSAATKGGKLQWQKIDPGAIMSHGASWNRCVPFHDRNALIVLGNRDRDIAADYEHRQTNFDHVAFIDLEAFGIYAPPLRVLPPLVQEMGLATLAQPGDFEIVCADGKRLSCSRKLLETRWEWFAQHISDFKGQSQSAFKDLGKASAQAAAAAAASSTGEAPATATKDKELSELRISPRSLHLPEPSPVVYAALQYFYTLALCTPLQHQVNTLIGLLLFSKT